MNANSSDRSSQLATKPAAPAEVVAYLIDPGAGSAMDRVQRDKPNASQMADIQRRGGSVTPLAPVAALRTPTQAPSTGAVPFAYAIFGIVNGVVKLANMKPWPEVGEPMIDDDGWGEMWSGNEPLYLAAPPVMQPASPAVEVARTPSGEVWDANPDGIAPGQDSGPRMNRDTGMWEGAEADEDTLAYAAIAAGRSPGDSVPGVSTVALVRALNKFKGAAASSTEPANSDMETAFYEEVSPALDESTMNECQAWFNLGWGRRAALERSK